MKLYEVTFTYVTEIYDANSEQEAKEFALDQLKEDVRKRGGDMMLDMLVVEDDGEIETKSE